MRTSVILCFNLIILSVLTACSDAAFNAGGGVRPGGMKDETTCKKPPCNVPPGEFDPNDPNSLKVRYGKDIKPSVADYLFVLDNSVSMADDATRVSQGLASIAEETFPDSTRLAVMTTMAAADPSALSLVVHSDINRNNYGSCINKEPGFLSFVDRASVASFKSCVGVPAAYASKYSMDACESGWFKPFDVNTNGQRCFAAALQNAFHPVGCEPGLLALEQLLQRNAGKPLFRENAAVSVIFISDEQEGCSSVLTRGSPNDAPGTADRLKAAILQNSKAASIKFHGIIPPESSVPSHTLSYVKVVNHLGGKVLPISGLTANYSSMIEQIISDKIDNTAPEFFIPATAKKVTSVEVDGVVTTAYTFNSSNSKVTVQGLDPQKTVDIVIRFE